MDLKARYRQIRALKWMSPGSFILCAITFAAVYVVLHLAGLRSHTSVLCGTFAAKRGEQVLDSFFATIYILFYMATVIVAPILVIAAGIFQALIKFKHGEQATATTKGPSGAAEEISLTTPPAEPPAA